MSKEHEHVHFSEILLFCDVNIEVSSGELDNYLKIKCVHFD